MTEETARTVHVVSSLQIGGAERFTVDLASAQLRAGCAVSIIELGPDEQALADDARRLGVCVIRAGRHRSRLARVAHLAGMLAGRAQVLHIHNPGALRALLPVLPTVRGPVIYTRHGASPYAAPSWRAVHRIARPFVDRVTFVTREARRSYEAVHGASPERHVVVENGVPVPPYAPRRAADRLRIGMVGRLVQLKGQHHVLDAVRALGAAARARVELHAFGDGPERDRLRELARGLPVVFHGTVLDREQIYAAIDVLVVASRTEGQSLAIMEAMARGVPAIATRVGGNPEFVRDDDTGILVPPGDPAAIRDALERVLAEPALLARFGRASHARIAAHHAIDAVAATYRELYAS
ncbi:MAG: glycosyltransferase family 4 protein [Deltaproteobacteria bacterium]|nr:glycosyltransferase family 4 protein [Deltaproteobacteria bacterium]